MKKSIIVILVFLLSAMSVFAATKWTAKDWMDTIGTQKTVKSVESDSIPVTIRKGNSSDEGSMIIRFFKTKNGSAVGFFIYEKGSRTPIAFARKEELEVVITLDYGRIVRMLEPENMFGNCPLTFQDHDMKYFYNQLKNCKFVDVEIISITNDSSYTFHIEYDKAKFEKAVSSIVK